MAETHLLTVAEAAERLRVHAATVRSWARDGRIPTVRIGRAWRIDAGALDAGTQREGNDGRRPPD